MELKKHRRAVTVVGGSGFPWKMPPDEARKWDHGVSQFVGIANSVCVMAIGGQEYYDRMVSAPDGAHFATETDTITALVEMLQDAVDAMYAAKPNGSFARAQRLTGIVGPSASAGVDSATAPSASAEELEAAAAVVAAGAA